MSDKLVSIILLTWNGSRFLDGCIGSVISQSYQPIELIVVDNGSCDNTPEILRKNIHENSQLNWKIEFLPENTGFAQGVNRGIALSSGRYILTLNQDVVLSEVYVEKLVEEFARESSKSTGSAAGKILRFQTDINNSGEIIDSAGHVIFTDRIVEARGKNQPAERFNEPCSVFGVSASAAMYDRKAIESVSLDDEIFDKDFFSYLEDVDLDYRLILKGYESRYVPEAVAKHALSGSGGRKIFSIRFRAFTNRYLVWIKNERCSEMMKDFGAIAIQEIFQFIRTLFTSPLMFLSWFVFPGKAVRVRRKGRKIYNDGYEYEKLRKMLLSGRLKNKLGKSSA